MQVTERLIFPDTIYAVGGAGKELVFSMLKSEWIVKEMLRPSSKPNNCLIVIIDTAIDEGNKDRDLISKIEKNKESVRKAYLGELQDNEDTTSRPGDFRIEYELLTEEMVLRTPYDLIGNDVKNSIIGPKTGAKVWWLNDELIHPDWNAVVMSKENLRSLDFAKGVYRKRAIGKAIFYKALSENRIVFDQTQGRNIDIICGFGGGSGSGIALDLARMLKSSSQTSDINLFGVLSTLEESEDEKANCACMLSELEYIKTAGTDICEYDRNLFKNIILFPINATKYCGESSRNPKSEQLLAQFDDAFPYALIAYHNSSGQDIFNPSPSYMPFKIAVPQLIRYNVDKIKLIQNELTKAVERKNESLGIEGKIYDSINKYIVQDFGQNISSDLVDEDKIFMYNDRYMKFEGILKSEYFKVLQYNNLLELKQITENSYDYIREDTSEINPSDKVEQIIRYLLNEIDTIGISKKEIDAPMFSVLSDDLRMMNELIQTLKKINGIEDPFVRNTLKEIVKIKDSKLSRKLGKIDSTMEKKKEEKNDLNNEANKLEIESNKLEAEINHLIESENKKWLNKISPDIENLESLHQQSDDLIEDFNELKNGIDSYVEQVNSKTSKKEIDLIGTPNHLLSKLDEFERRLGNLNLKFFNKNDTYDFIISTKDLKISLIRSNLKLNFMDKFIPGRTKKEIAIKQGESDLEEYKHRLKLLYINDSGQICFKLDSGITDDISNKRKDLIDSIMYYPVKEYSNENYAELSELKSKLDKCEVENLSLDKIIRSYKEYDKKKDDLFAQSTEIDDKISKLSNVLIKYEDLKKLTKDIALQYQSNITNLEKYHLFMEGDQLQNTGEQYNQDNNFKYVHEIQPKNLFQIMSLRSDINDILSDNVEKSDLLEAIRTRFLNTEKQIYNGLVRNLLEDGASLERWNKTELALSLITNVKKGEMEQNVFENDKIKEMYGAFGVDNNNFNRWVVGNGDSWSVGIVTFIGGILTDNLQNLVAPGNGYYAKFNGIKNNPDKMSFFHSSYLLEVGQLVERDKIFELTGNDIAKFFTSDDDIKKLISENLEVCSLKEYAEDVIQDHDV